MILRMRARVDLGPLRSFLDKIKSQGRAERQVASSIVDRVRRVLKDDFDKKSEGQTGIGGVQWRPKPRGKRGVHTGRLRRSLDVTTEGGVISAEYTAPYANIFDGGRQDPVTGQQYEGFKLLPDDIGNDVADLLEDSVFDAVSDYLIGE